MKLTNDHLRYWRNHQPQPSWAKNIQRMQRPPTIHTLINSQTDERISSEPHNTLSILRSLRQRGEPLLPKIQEMMLRPNCQHGAKRAAFCKKWWKRLMQDVNVRRAAWAEELRQEGVTW